MDTLSIEQLKTIPWIQNYLTGDNIPSGPPIENIYDLCNVPFKKRNKKYHQFYIWLEVIKLVPENKKVILDAACGMGQISQALFLKGHTVYACDIEDCFKGDRGIKFKTTDLNNQFPYKSSFFDVVLNSTALHYLDNPKHFFNESYRIIKPNGYLIFTAPNLNCIFSRASFVKTGKIIDYGSLNRPSVLYEEFFRKYLDSIGFNYIDIKGSTPRRGLKVSLFKLIYSPIMKLTGNPIIDLGTVIIYKFQKKR